MIFAISDSFTFITVLILTAIVGLCVGSFLNVVIYRLPNNMSLAKPASHCPNCGYKLKWFDNIPVLSYLFLGGKCRSCKKPISPRYIIVEITNALLWVASLLLFKNNVIYALVSAIALSCCICIFFTDLEHMIIFDRFQIIIGVLAVLTIFLDENYSWLDHLIGGVGAFVVFYAVGFIVSKILKKDALGGGDIKFAGVTGLFLGWQKFLFMMLIASIVASVVMTVIRFKNNGESKEVPFGPFLTVAFAIVLFVGNFVLDWYLGILSAF